MKYPPNFFLFSHNLKFHVLIVLNMIKQQKLVHCVLVNGIKYQAITLSYVVVMGE